MLLNIFSIFLTFLVSNSAINFNLWQSLNIWSIVVTDEVSKWDKSREMIELQLLNVYSIFNTLEVVIPDKSNVCNLLQSLNI